MRPDGIVVQTTTETKVGVFCILEYKIMSDVTSQYLLRSPLKTENQYVSLPSVLRDTIHRQGSMVEQINFITTRWGYTLCTNRTYGKPQILQSPGD